MVFGIGKRARSFRSETCSTLDMATQRATHAAINNVQHMYGFEIDDYNVAAAMKEWERRRVAEGWLVAHKAEYVSVREQVRSFNIGHPTHSEEQYLKQRWKRRIADVNAMYWKMECMTARDELVRS